MSVQTRSQKLAQSAFRQVNRRLVNGENGKVRLDDKYESFAKKFPALIHTCGLAQALAFGEAKGQSKPDKVETQYLDDLAAVLHDSGHLEILTGKALAKKSREESLSGYLRLSRDAINAAAWLKRYVEAAGEGE